MLDNLPAGAMRGTPYVPRDSELHYLITAADGKTRPTSVPDSPEARWYLEWSVRAPLAHQVRDFIRFRDGQRLPGIGLLQAFALFYEQRARKTKVALDVFRYRYERGDVDALVVVAYPNGVHRIWLDESQKDFPPEFLAQLRTLAWASGRTTGNKASREEALSLRAHPGPIVVTFNSEAIARTKKAIDYLEWLLKKRRVMLVADEAAFMANWTAITQKMGAFGRRPNVVIKAILDGTPVSEGPGEIYHPTQFLHRALLGFATKDAFRARYFEYEEEEVPETRKEMVVCPQCAGVQLHRCFICAGEGRVETEVPTGRVLVRRVTKERWNPNEKKVQSTYEVFKGYRNMEELEAKLKTFGSRVLRSDVSDAPPKTYQSRYFELSDAQRRVYDDLRSRYVAEIEGREVRAANVLLRMIRLQMVARNFYPPEKTGEACVSCGGEGWRDDEECAACDGLGVVVRVSELRRIDPTCNPAIDALVEEIRVAGGPVIVWCAFRQDVLDALEATRKLGLSYFRYDGGVPEADREKSYQEFRDGAGDGMVATIPSGLHRGKDLSRAAALVYYSNNFSLRKREQSEDRAESLDRQTSTGIIDLIAADTRDLQVIEALRDKRSIAEMIMGDPRKSWL